MGITDIKGRRCHRKYSDLNIALVRGHIPSSLGMAGGLGGCTPCLMMIMVVSGQLSGPEPRDQQQMLSSNFISWYG